MALSLKTVQQSAPDARPYEIRDGAQKGLMLRVQPSGVKSYVVELARGKRRTIGNASVITLEQARRTARTWLSEYDSGKLPPAARGHSRPSSLGQFITERYAPWVLAERRAGAATLAALKAQFSDLYPEKLAAISPYKMDRFKAARLRDGIKPATVNRDLVRIRAVLSKAIEWGYLESHPMKNVERAKGDDEQRARFMTPEEEGALRAALDAREIRRRKERDSGNRWNAERRRPGRPSFADDGYTDHLAPLVLVAINTGMRRGELFGLNWSNVDLTHRVITVTAATSKGQRTRRIPLNEEAFGVLKRWRGQGSGEGLVFPGEDRRALTNINKSWAGLIAAAQIEDLRFHDLRHHFASRLVMAGAELYVVKELLGHSDLTMTERYSHLAPSHKARAVAMLERTP